MKAFNTILITVNAWTRVLVVATLYICECLLSSQRLLYRMVTHNTLDKASSTKTQVARGAAVVIYCYLFYTKNTPIHTVIYSHK